MYVKTAIIFGSIVASYYGAFYGCTTLQTCVACAVVLGMAMGEVGVSIMHDANHGAYSTNSWVTWLMSASLDIVGASSFMWRQQHVVGHHAYTNVEDVDPDIRVSDPDVRRVTPKQPWQPYHVCAWEESTSVSDDYGSGNATIITALPTYRNTNICTWAFYMACCH